MIRTEKTATVMGKTVLAIGWFFICGLVLMGCSIKQLAVDAMAEALSGEGSDVFATDDDPQLVGEALPFTLKTMEALLRSSPDNRKLLVATSAGFVQYGHAFVLRPAEALEESDLESARKGRQRAKRLFLRARDYGTRALELDHPGFSEKIVLQPVQAVEGMRKADVPALYWTGAAWGSAISADKSDMALIGDLPSVTAIMEKALELDESWNRGAIHEFFIIYDAGRTAAEGGGAESAETHFQRAMELNEGQSVAPLVALAESVCVKQQDRERFESLLKQALETDIDPFPQYRLANILAQQRAKYLLANVDGLFF